MAATFPALEIHLVPSATIVAVQALAPAAAAAAAEQGLSAWRAAFSSDLQPVAVAGFGGYPSFPPVLAAARLEDSVLIHEQNAVMGRANRVLSRFADAVASSFPTLGRSAGTRSKGKLVLYRQSGARACARRSGRALSARRRPMSRSSSWSSAAARARGSSPNSCRQCHASACPRRCCETLKVVQQCRPEDLERVKAAYRALELACELAAVFQRHAAAHCRGASRHLPVGRLDHRRTWA